MLQLKHSARIGGLQPEMVLGLMICEGIYAAHGWNCVVTSGTSGKHMDTSLHYKGLAADLRIWMIPEKMREKIAGELAEALGPEFDVVFEGDHYHIEADYEGLVK